RQPLPRPQTSSPFLMRFLEPFPKHLPGPSQAASCAVLLALALLLAGGAGAQPAPPAKPKPAASPPPRGAAAPAPQASKAGQQPPRPLPDSVLMRIDDREDVTVRRFKRAVRLLAGDPDSLPPPDRDRFLDLVLEQRVLAAHVAKKRLPWTPADSARYRYEVDNTLMRAALSDRLTDVENRRRAAGQPE